ncbi:MAG: SOS response-associated peptidase [archaeon]
MCGRYSLFQISQTLNRWMVEAEQPLKPRYNIAPSQEVPIITNVEPHKITMARFGMIPEWSKDGKIDFATINARVETITEKATYKKAFQSQRCIVPADGFYEWKKVGNSKIPYRFTLTTDQVFGMAGIYSVWKDELGNLITSMSIITVVPNETVKPIHERMPAVLKIEHEKLWLGKTPADVLLKDVLKPYPGNEMKCYQVSDAINSAADDRENMIEPVSSKGSLLGY